MMQELLCAFILCMGMLLFTWLGIPPLIWVLTFVYPMLVLFLVLHHLNQDSSNNDDDSDD